MNRQTSLTLIATLTTALTLAACNRDQPAPVTPAPTPAPVMTPDPMTAPAPVTTPVPANGSAVTVSTVDLGTSLGADNRVGSAVTSFRPADTINASVATDGAGGNVTARWTYSDGQVVDEQTKMVSGGPQVTAFTINKPDGFPTGNYQLTVSVDGQVIQTRDFTVQ